MNVWLHLSGSFPCIHRYAVGLGAAIEVDTDSLELQVPPAQLAWFHQGHVGYMVLATADEGVQVELRLNSAIAATDTDEADKKVDLEMFHLSIVHGVNCTDASYAYVAVVCDELNSRYATIESFKIKLRNSSHI